MEREKGFWSIENIALLVALVLFALCWVLPILDHYIGWDGAREAHVGFWRLLAEGHELEPIAKIFEISFISIGWLANELFVVGFVVLKKRPLMAVRCFAFSLGIMISWQILFLDKFPLLIGYWFWVAAGLIMLITAAKALGRESGQSPRAIIMEPVTLLLLVVPVANAVIGVFSGMNL